MLLLSKSLLAAFAVTWAAGAVSLFDCCEMRGWFFGAQANMVNVHILPKIFFPKVWRGFHRLCICRFPWVSVVCPIGASGFAL